MFKTVVHQTIDLTDDAEKVENDGPFKARTAKQSYLGLGYYFWDNHIELAHWWGKIHCGNSYYICDSEFHIDYEDFFDIVGRREHQIFLRDTINKLKWNNLSIGQIIEGLKKMNITHPTTGIFPYKAIRAIDLEKVVNDDDVYHYSEREKDGITTKLGIANLSPSIIICLLEKNRVHLLDYKILYPAALSNR